MMITREISINIDRPVEQVFATLVDSKNQPKWDSRAVGSPSHT